MRERPILLKPGLVEAVLAGRKTQTRRILKVQPPGDGYQLATCFSTTGNRRDEGRHHWIKLQQPGNAVIDGSQPYFASPYGYVGDVLYVRETHLYIPGTNQVLFADHEEYGNCYPDKKASIDLGWRVRPSIHMPRQASRIDLMITGVRVERLQDITDEDAWKEGVDQDEVLSMGCTTDSARAAFSALWKRVHGEGSWEVNPHVWVIDFERKLP